jgi:hypothetical protein
MRGIATKPAPLSTRRGRYGNWALKNAELRALGALPTLPDEPARPGRREVDRAVWLGYCQDEEARPKVVVTLARIGFQDRLDIDDPRYVPQAMWAAG